MKIHNFSLNWILIDITDLNFSATTRDNTFAVKMSAMNKSTFENIKNACKHVRTHDQNV